MKQLILIVLLLTTPSFIGCGSSGIKTNISPVADVANAGGRIEDSAHEIFVAAKDANATVNPATGKPLLQRKALDDVAIAVNKIGYLGLDLKAGLDDYNAAKAAGKDLTAQRAAILKIVTDLNRGLADIGKAIPPGTLATIDQLVTTILGIITQVKVGVGL